ncbi:MAG: hypothetical protein WC755_01960 [Candidatus Woesearchaeota archaeon]|jgi:hypothetical protein
MNIDISKLHSLWYEDKNGNKMSIDEYNVAIEKGEFIYQHSMFPSALIHKCLKMIVKEEVDGCKHPADDVCKTYGWIGGTEGRKCNLCGGEQIKKTDKEWPEKWEASGSKEIFSGLSTWSEDLVLAMANSRDYTLGQSILIAANSCTRCMNSLAFKYGLSWGYDENSEEWKTSNTACNFCRVLN